MNEPYKPEETLYTKVEKRKVPYSNSKMMNPVITWAMIVSIAMTASAAGIGYNQMGSDIRQAVSVSLAQHLTAMEAIDHETDLRIIVTSNVNENVDEVKEDVKELKKEVKDGNEKTQELLRQLLQKQNNT